MNNISSIEFKKNLPRLHILDIRTPREWDELNFGGIHVPLDDLLNRMAELDPTILYTIICYNGTQSYIACRLLSSKGFQCQHLEGGIEGYLSL
jgi:adenylyltransferase/sulfurtransferase